jgi:hypothetical protein
MLSRLLFFDEGEKLPEDIYISKWEKGISIKNSADECIV